MKTKTQTIPSSRSTEIIIFILTLLAVFLITQTAFAQPAAVGNFQVTSYVPVPSANNATTKTNYLTMTPVDAAQFKADCAARAISAYTTATDIDGNLLYCDPNGTTDEDRQPWIKLETDEISLKNVDDFVLVGDGDAYDPQAKLQVKGTFLVETNPLTPEPVLDFERLIPAMGFSSNGAFRAGSPGMGDTWSSERNGNFSFAGGMMNTAAGDYSTAFGNNNNISAAGTYGFAAGINNSILAPYSVAIGNSNHTSADGGHNYAIGKSNSLTGQDVGNVYAFGENISIDTDSNVYAFGRNIQTQASGSNAVIINAMSSNVSPSPALGDRENSVYIFGDTTYVTGSSATNDGVAMNVRGGEILVGNYLGFSRYATTSSRVMHHAAGIVTGAGAIVASSNDLASVTVAGSQYTFTFVGGFCDTQRIVFTANTISSSALPDFIRIISTTTTRVVIETSNRAGLSIPSEIHFNATCFDTAANFGS